MDSADRLELLIKRAIARRKFGSVSEFFQTAGFKSRGQLQSWRSRLKDNPEARIGNISAMARALDMSVEDFEEAVFGSFIDPNNPYPSRDAAVSAARKLQLPEEAIAVILGETPSSDPGSWYWFKRIEAEASRILPFASFNR